MDLTEYDLEADPDEIWEYAKRVVLEFKEAMSACGNGAMVQPESESRDSAESLLNHLPKIANKV
jgi:hypothetical protein